MGSSRLTERFLLTIIFASILIVSANAEDKRKKTSEAQKLSLETISKSCDIEIVTTAPQFPVKTTHGMIDGGKADPRYIKAYSSLFVAEFGIYPPEFVKKTKLKRVVFCTQLSFDGQLRNAIPDYEHDVLYLEVQRGSDNLTYLRAVIHHEFFHIVDFRDDGLVYQDERWSAINPANFTYGNGGRAAQDIRTTALLTERFPGFLTHYSTTGVEEDKAECFAHMIVSPVYVHERAKIDPIVSAKIDRMKQGLSDFCPEIDGKFWERVWTGRQPMGKGRASKYRRTK